jgi:hypothetical protein
MGESKSFYGYNPDSTLLSLLIRTLPASDHKQYKSFKPRIPNNDRSIFAFIIRITTQGLHDVYGFNIDEVSINNTGEPLLPLRTILKAHPYENFVHCSTLILHTALVLP